MSSEPSNICENCGWNNALKQWVLPDHIVTGETGNDNWVKVVYGCSKELNDDKETYISVSIKMIHQN